ncbi:MAG: UDP-glucose/GDP-mannose dehydrogenase family protein [Streptosporangiaceae bacterium]|nr:UDP-glucose/GDP-mannose dehydrogenase family protein [Streptosporangiaceae bacterium]MBV9855011.1 UDP-glucose/GDP-mannose dehydrogenase family protein [Streptosporangiaceae bacterium]
MRLTVIGCGHLGAALAACMAEIGHEVLGADTDESKVQLLSEGRAWFAEPGLDEMLARNIATGGLRFTTSFAEAGRFATVHFLAVPTPELPDDDGFDLSQVYAAARTLAPHLNRPALVIGKSTVPPGTTAALARELAARAPARDAVEVAWIPEFLRGGFALADTLRPDRIVAGVPSAAAESVVREVYQPLAVPLLFTDPATAEMAKVAANAFLATKISFINAIGDICAGAGADVAVLADALGMDPRIGRTGLTAGLGYGGGCMPKDIRGLAAFAVATGANSAARLLSAVDEINASRRQRIVNLLTAVAGPLRGKRIALWGGAFKVGTDDVRDSPGLDVADRLSRLGAEIVVYDPMATGNALVAFPHLGYADSALAAAHQADAVLVVTPWPEFATVNPAAAGAAVATRLLIDACQAVSPPLWRAAGWTVAAPYPAGEFTERIVVPPATQ